MAKRLRRHPNIESYTEADVGVLLLLCRREVCFAERLCENHEEAALRYGRSDLLGPQMASSSVGTPMIAITRFRL